MTADAQLRTVQHARGNWLASWRSEAQEMTQRLNLREQEMQALVSVLETMTIKAAEHQEALLLSEKAVQEHRAAQMSLAARVDAAEERASAKSREAAHLSREVERLSAAVRACQVCMYMLEKSLVVMKRNLKLTRCSPGQIVPALGVALQASKL